MNSIFVINLGCKSPRPWRHFSAAATPRRALLSNSRDSPVSPNMPLLIFSFLLLSPVLGLPDPGQKPRKCGECVQDLCVPPSQDCLSGLVRDLCGCCYVCGGSEGEACDGDELPAPYRGRGRGPCGEGLECRLRTDLAPGDPPETQCVCLKNESFCGSDGRTYANECELTQARYKQRNGLQAVYKGPCRSAPKILSPPEDVSNTTGGNVALSCEASGWPIPSLEWRVDRGEGDTVPLPSDDPKIAVQSRGGPSKYEVTSWLQLLDIQPEDDAIYWCVARNEEGESTAAARIILLDSRSSLFKTDRNNDL